MTSVPWLARGIEARETIEVAEFCTCGTSIIEGALFCHKCGRPLRPIPNLEPETQPAPVHHEGDDLRAAASAAAAALPQIGFHNRVAVRTAIAIALFSSLLSLLRMPSLFDILWKFLILVCAGFLAVYVYHRRTGQFLSVRNGARMGWLTGVFFFLIALVLFSVGMMALSHNGGLAAWKDQLRAQAAPGVEVEEIMRVLESPEGLAIAIASTVLFAFLIFTGLPMIGGALGAKVLEKV